jgi:uncharacterized SAM-dependent methyltransferase
LGTGIGVAVAIIEVITKLPDYYTSRKQANYLSMYMRQINKKYYEFNNDGNGRIKKLQYLHNLERDTIACLLQRRKRY